MEEGDLLHPQRAGRSKVGGPVRGDDHHQQGPLLLQAELRQGVLYLESILIKGGRGIAVGSYCIGMKQK